MRKLRIIAWLGTLFLAACGGDTLSSSGTSTTGGTTGPTVAALSVSTSAATIAADGSTSATISAVAKDSNNNFVSGVKVSFTSSAGGLAITQATTDTNGLATATLTAGTAAAGTAITVNASAGTASGKVTVTVANVQQTISVITSLPSIPSDSSKSATITALVRNASNVLVPGVAVSFTASSGGLTVTQATTDSNGAATATLDAAGDPSNRTITVTATAGTATATVPVSVTGTSLTVTGPTNLVEGSQGTFTVSLTEAGGSTGIPNQAVALTSANGNTLSAASVTTAANGQQTFTVTATKGGTDTITAKALNLTGTAQVAVSTQNFAFTTPSAANTPINIGTAASPTVTNLVVTWTSGGVPQTGQVVNFSATRGTLSASTATVQSDGTATVSISSTTSGPSIVTATATGVTAQASIDFISTDPAAIALQASPSTIATQAQSTITATVRDPNNNLVEGQVVDFSIVQDPTGGSLSVPSAVTNVQGQATTVYTASTTTSATNGIVISATVPNPPVPPVSTTTNLTVGGETVYLSLGTGNTITEYSSTQYELPYTVQAVDAAGNGVNNVTVTFNVSSLGYYKGVLAWNGNFWAPVYSTLTTDPDAYPPAVPPSTNGGDGCLSEDLLNNGVYVASEDYNHNGRLDPGLVVSTDVGSATTANGGSAAVNLIYPKDHANWVAVKLTVTATVSGSENSTSTSFTLPGASADYNSETVTPPGPTSPYGYGRPCSNPQ